jgi:hypothetical protein
MILALLPPVRAIPVMARERYDDVLVAVVMRIDQSNVSGPCLYSGYRCDGRGVARFVRSRANQRRGCECTDSPPHDVSLLYSCSFVAPAHSHIEPGVAKCPLMTHCGHWQG